jgi:hypothetical protein
MYVRFKYSESYTRLHLTFIHIRRKRIRSHNSGAQVRVQVVECSKGYKGYLHISVMLSKVDSPESQLPLPVLGVHHKHGPPVLPLGSDGKTHFCSENGENL